MTPIAHAHNIPGRHARHFARVAQRHCISSFPAEQDGGGHVGRDSRYRLARGPGRPPEPVPSGIPPVQIQHAGLTMNIFAFEPGTNAPRSSSLTMSAATTLPALVPRPRKVRK